MAIERQFLPLIPAPKGIEPAVLVYLRMVADKRLDSQGRKMGATADFLTQALDKRVFAKTLAAMIWGDETPLKVAMNLTLKHPTQIESEAVGFSHYL